MDSCTDIIFNQYAEAYNEILALYDSGDDQDTLKEVVERLRALLKESAMPRYHRMKALLLLSSTELYVREALKYHREAEVLWNIVRANEPEGEDSRIEAALEEVKEYIDGLRPKLVYEREDRDAEEEEEEEEEQSEEEPTVEDSRAEHRTKVAEKKAFDDKEERADEIAMQKSAE